MKLILVRHGETTENVRKAYAGSMDSALTAHGMNQILRLGGYLASPSQNLAFERIFSSDLSRAATTAQGIADAQAELGGRGRSGSPSGGVLEVERLAALREQDFGSMEGRVFGEKKNELPLVDPWIPIETWESMKARTLEFVQVYLLPCILHILSKDLPQVAPATGSGATSSPARPNVKDRAVALVAHGIILGVLWKQILASFEPQNVSLAAGVDLPNGIEHLGSWSNTGFTVLEINFISSAASSQKTSSDSRAIATLDSSDPRSLSLVVKAVNYTEHLKGLKRTHGGIGSAKYDNRQQTITSLFQKRGGLDGIN